jgi:hypothetical protein
MISDCGGIEKIPSQVKMTLYLTRICQLRLIDRWEELRTKPPLHSRNLTIREVFHVGNPLPQFIKIP